MQVLIVEDEVRLAAALKEILEKEKYMVDVVHDGDSGLDYILSGIYDVIVLDVMLPGKDGFTVAKEARAARVDTPIIMLTARNEIQNRVKGLDAGADDYMTKPFAPSELLARIRAVTRRQGEVITEKLTFGDLELDLATCQLSKGAKSIHLNYKEFELLKLLIANQGTPLTKDALITKIWGYDSEASDNNVEAYISFLRKKIAFLGSTAKISALRKVGYIIEAN
ncbi:MAG: response regulator transcription factor [Clostridiales bacterium]|nr:response regulator transcription factor [Clostridiales bacterium]